MGSSRFTDKSLEALVENGSPKPENSDQVQEAKAASLLVVLAKKESSVRSTVNFLVRRGFAAKIVSNLNEAVELFSKKEANMLLLSLNFPHPKVEMLPVLMNQSFKIETILFAEDNDRKTSNKLNNAKSKHVLFGPVSGPVVMMKIRQIDRELSGEEDDTSAGGDKRVASSKDEEGDIKVGGRKGSNDDTVVLNGKADSKEKASFENMMKSLSDDDDLDSGSRSSLARSGETYIQKGDRSKMHSAGGVDSDESDLGEPISQNAQNLRAGLDRGLRAVDPASRRRLMMPNSFVAPSPEVSAYEKAAEALRQAETEKAAALAQARAEREAAEAAKKAERDALLASEKAAREATAAAQRAEREEAAAKMKAEREAQAVQAKSDREAAVAAKKAEREAADVEAKAAAARAQVEKQSAEARAHEAALAKLQAEREQKALENASAAGAQGNASKDNADAHAKNAKSHEGANAKAKEADARGSIASHGERAGKTEGHDAQAALSQRAEERSDQPSPSEQHSDDVQPSDGAAAYLFAALTEAEKLALTTEEKIRRCLHEALAITAGAPKNQNSQLSAHVQAALVSLRTTDFNCAFIVSLNHARNTAAELFHRMEVSFFSLLRDHGIEFENNQTYSIRLDNMKIVREAFAISDFSIITKTNEIEMGAAKVNVQNPKADTSPYEENMHLISLKSLTLEEPVTFNLFLHLKRNNKFLRYLKSGSSISQRQVDRLEKRSIQGLVESGEVEAYQRYFAAHSIKRRAA